MEIRITIGEPNEETIGQVALLHQQGIVKGFLSSLGTEFLSVLYKAISRSPYSGVAVAMDGDTVAGFAAVTLSTKKMYSWIFRRYWLRLGFAFMMNYLSLVKLMKALETMGYGLLRKQSGVTIEPRAELLSIVVAKNCRKKGVGKQLIDVADEFFLRKQIDAYCVVTGADDSVSNGFYLSSGFTLNKKFHHHKILMNEYLKHLHHSPGKPLLDRNAAEKTL
jgi:ribosomal protein S18 acetylase RimI-like enzyme